MGINESVFALMESDVTHPFRATPKSAGADVCAYVDDDPDTTGRFVTIEPHRTHLVRSAIRLKEPLPHGYYLQMSLRSSWRKKGLTSNGVGIIDGDYKDEIFHLVCNTTEAPIHIEHGDRLSQLIVLQHRTDLLGCPVKEQERIGGFGSTGK